MAKKLDVVTQSKCAYNQWKDLWRKNATENKKKAPFKNLGDFFQVGVGKACLVVGNGYSLEENINTIIANQENIDIICCDKTLGHLLDHGIKPTYCLVADAQVNYEKYMEPWKDQLEDTILVSVVTANPKWVFNGNWKSQYFFCVEDAIQTEKEFVELTGCTNVVPAGTNVGNMMVVLLTLSSNRGRQNFFGYDKIVLIGFDFCWRADGKYYAFDEHANGKDCYMKHVYALTRDDRHCYTSSNLLFSAQWLENYLSVFKLPVVLGSGSSILGVIPYKDLDKQIKYKSDTRNSYKLRNLFGAREKLRQEIAKLDQLQNSISKKHWLDFIAST